jgi:hypothetical protein
VVTPVLVVVLVVVEIPAVVVVSAAEVVVAETVVEVPELVVVAWLDVVTVAGGPVVVAGSSAAHAVISNTMATTTMLHRTITPWLGSRHDRRRLSSRPGPDAPSSSSRPRARRSQVRRIAVAPG